MVLAQQPVALTLLFELGYPFDQKESPCPPLSCVLCDPISWPVKQYH